jgi:photosystem II stability/assembly factor-like uncharacterized protein
MSKSALRLAALSVVLAGWGCGKGSPGQGAADHPPAATDAGAGGGGGSGDDGPGGLDAGAAADVPAPMSCTGAPLAVTPAPADTDAPPAATGPYLWRGVSIVAGGFVTGIVFSPAQRDVVYARTDIGGAYRWNAASRRWLPLLDWIPRASSNWSGVESIAVDPLDANKVYVAAGTYVNSGGGAMLRSSDQGRSFQITTTNIPMGGNADGRSVGERLIVDPNHPSTLYFGSRSMGLWKSTDGAATWSRVAAFPAPATTPNGVGVAFVVLDPASCGPGGDTTVYAGVATTGTSLYRSLDGGTTWVAVPGQPAGLLPSHGAVSATGKLYVTYGGGTGNAGSGPNQVTTGSVWRLDVRAGAWTEVTPLAPPPANPFGYAGVSVDAAHPDTVVVSTLDRWSVGDDIYRSTDAGAHWKPLDVPGSQHDISAAPWVTFHQSVPNYTGWMADVEIDPFNPARILHVTGQGIWASDDVTAADADQPTHWDFRSQGIEETAVLDLASPPAGPPLLSAVGDVGGFRHDDLGVTPPTGMWSNPVLTNTDAIDFAEGAPSVVARVGRIRGDDGTTLSPSGALSTDGGATWSPFPTILPAPTSSAGSIAVSADGAILVWDAPANTRATPSFAGGPQYSRDGGMTWTPSTGLGAVRPVVADRVNASKFYAFDTMARFWVSTDGAASFAASPAAGLPRGTGRPRAVPGIEGDVWLVTAMGLRHSVDSGTSFSTIATATAPVALGFGKAAPGKSYPALYLIGTVGGTAGIYRSDDTGATWSRIDDDQHLFATAGIIIGDPRVYGRAYVGTNGRGVLYGEPAASATP